MHLNSLDAFMHRLRGDSEKAGSGAERHCRAVAERTFKYQGMVVSLTKKIFVGCWPLNNLLAEIIDCGIFSVETSTNAKGAGASERNVQYLLLRTS